MIISYGQTAYFGLGYAAVTYSAPDIIVTAPDEMHGTVIISTALQADPGTRPAYAATHLPQEQR